MEHLTPTLRKGTIIAPTRALASVSDGGPALSIAPPDFWEWFSSAGRRYASDLALAVHFRRPSYLHGLFGSTGLDFPQARGFRCSYTQLFEAVEKLSAFLHRQGVGQGDVLASFIGNEHAVEWVLLLWTSWRLGAVFATVEPGLLARKRELTEVRGLLKAKVIVTGGWKDVESWPVDESQESWRTVKLVCGECAERDTNEWIALASLIRESRGLPLAPKTFSTPEQAALIIFTSGTTNTPKACQLSFANVFFEIEGHHSFAGSQWSSSTKFLVTTSAFRPLCYLGSLSSWTKGGAVVFAVPSFDPGPVIESLRLEKATHLMLVPSQLRALVKEFQKQKLPLVHQLLFMTSGGDVHDQELISNAQSVLSAQRCVAHWGMSEGSPIIGFMESYSERWVDSSPALTTGEVGVGHVLPGTKVKICVPEVDSPTPVPRGTRGELHTSSPALIPAYLGSTSHSCFYKDLCGTPWFRTGDLAVMDNEGIVYVTGRLKDTIKFKGIGLFPPTIEQWLKECYGVEVSAILA